MTDLIHHHDEIVKVLQLYIDGASKGDATKLRQAFHPEGRMFGQLAGARLDIPISEFVAMAVDQPADTGAYRGRVLSVTVVGDAAAAVVAEEGCWGTVSFIDFFTLARIDSNWKIVSKTFAQTGGQMPDA
jgi:Putative lumazine-binding